MIACPKCGSEDTRAAETRRSKHGARRRRWCSCGERFTTIEVILPSEGRRPADALALVRRKDLEALVRLVQEMTGAAFEPPTNVDEGESG